MKNITCALLLSFIVVSCAHGQTRIFDVASIPDALKKNAYSVKREERKEFTVKSIGKATYKVHKVITVLNEKGKDELSFHEFSDQFHSFESISIQLFDSRGMPTKKFRRSDFSTQTAGEGLVPDGKVYYIELPVTEYPVTVQYDYEISFKGLLNYPGYEVQLPEQSVENSIFIATVPSDLDLRFKARNAAIVPVTTRDEKNKIYTWSTQNLPALKHEAGSVSYESRYPRIILSPNKFELDDYPGDMSTWQNIGQWYGSLAKNTSNLTEERKLFFRSLVKDAASDREKAKIIYQYLQSNCRYVLIALGIGGFQPFPADFVDKKKYGDCKALSNYTHACLSAVGVKSHRALINASFDKEPVDPTFPNMGFNHEILCVPLKNDTIWLECTSNTNEFGVLGNFTENRNALLITEDGGRLVATPKSKATDNLFSSNTIIDLAEDGSGKVEVSLNTKGEYKDGLENYVNNQKKDDQKGYLINSIGYMQPDDFEINYPADKNAITTLNMSFGKIPEFTAGKKSFLNPRMYKIWNNALPKAEDRTQDFYFQHPFIKTDTTVYKLPAGFTVETLPKPRNIQFAYGSFTTSCEYDVSQQMIRSVVRLELNEYKIPAARYAETKVFFSKVLEEYTEKIVVKHL